MALKPVPPDTLATAHRGDIAAAVRRRDQLRWALLSGGVLLLVAVSWTSCFSGITEVTLPRVLHQLGVPVGDRAPTATEWTAFTQIRLPRVVVGALAGIALALCGAAMQVITANRMASPFTTGISNAAAFGAAAVVVTGWRLGGSRELAMVVGAFFWAVVCSALVFGMARTKALGSAAIILTGIAMNYLFSALNAAMQYVAGEQQLTTIVNWTFGNLGQATWSQIGVLCVLLVVAVPALLGHARHFNLLAMGDESAQAAGVHVRRLRGGTGLGITLVAACVVSFTGVIGFVGLVAPHLAALVIGDDHRYQFPLAALFGAALLVLADHVGRMAFSPVIVPVGIVVSLVGVPVFVWLILRHRGTLP